MKGDRLEPHGGLLDIGKFDDICSFPCSVLFWRRSRETLCTHRTPLFDRRLGVTPNRSIAIDVMHTTISGPCQSWGKLALWKLLTSGIWGSLESDSEGRLRVSIMTMRASLVSWYSAEARAGKVHTRIDFMTPKMIGTVQNPHLKLKAMEGYGFAQFLVYCLETYPVEGAQDLLLAGKVMIELIEVMKKAPMRLTMQIIQHMLNLWKQHMAILSNLEDSMQPKHHLTCHMIMRAVQHGNPWKDATFFDESLNKELKQCCRHAHQCNFETTVIPKMEEVLKRLLRKRRAQ